MSPGAPDEKRTSKENDRGDNACTKTNTAVRPQSAFPRESYVN